MNLSEGENKGNSKGLSLHGYSAGTLKPSEMVLDPE